MAIEIGAILDGKVTGITKFGAFVDLQDGKSGMVHISELATSYIKEISDFLTLGQTVKVKIISINEKGKINLSIKRAIEQLSPAPQHCSSNVNIEQGKKSEPSSFEDMLSKFKSSSDEKMFDIKRNVENKRGNKKNYR